VSGHRFSGAVNASEIHHGFSRFVGSSTSG